MLKALKIIGFTTMLCVVYLAFWPVPIEPKLWEPSEDPGYTGAYAPNNRLESFKALSMGSTTGPEAAILDANGDVIASSHEGWLVRFKGGSQDASKWVNLDGRPLGLDIDDRGNVWVANAYLGLQKVTPSGEVSLELNSVDGTRIGYADDVAIVNGKIYFSDATMRFYPQDWGGTLPASVLDVVEHGKTGRVIEYDPNTQVAKVVMTDLNFANGVAADPNGRFILVNETGEYRVWKLWLSGEKVGVKEVILSGLPGFPDNIHTGQNGLYWLGLVDARSKELDDIASGTFWRKVMVRLPEFMRPQNPKYGLVIGINQHGDVVENLQAPNGEVYSTTGLLETDTHIFVTSLTAPFLASITKQNAGL